MDFGRWASALAQALGAAPQAQRDVEAEVSALLAAEAPLLALSARVHALGRTTIADLVAAADAAPRRQAARWSTLLAARAAGREASRWMPWAGRLGELIGLLDVIEGVMGRTEAPAPAHLAAWAAALEGSPPAQAAFLRAVAGRLDAPPRALALQALLGEEEGVLALTEAWQAALEAQDALPEPAGRAAWLPLRAALAQRVQAARSGARFAHLLARAQPAPAFGLPAVEAALDALQAFLADDPRYRCSHEVQRWGLADDPAPQRGEWYVRAFITEARWEAGHPDEAALAALLGELPPEGPRYFGPWDRLPPDADSLGLFLMLAARLKPRPTAQVEGWLGPLFASLRPDQGVPTWLTEGPAGPTTPEPRWTWAGDDCLAVRAIALLGLLTWDAPRFAGIIAANLPAMAELTTPGRCFYYGPEVADLLLVRLAAALEQSTLRALAAPLTLRAGARVAALVHSQQLDGGWGRPQATALRLEALCRGGGPPLAIWRAARYLCDHQRPDGSFEVDGLYRTLGKPPYAFHGHGGPALTAAVALRALAAARPCLESM